MVLRIAKNLRNLRRCCGICWDLLDVTHCYTEYCLSCCWVPRNSWEGEGLRARQVIPPWYWAFLKTWCKKRRRLSKVMTPSVAPLSALQSEFFGLQGELVGPSGKEMITDSLNFFDHFSATTFPTQSRMSSWIWGCLHMDVLVPRCHEAWSREGEPLHMIISLRQTQQSQPAPRKVSVI